MSLSYREGTIEDIEQMISLAVRAWSVYESEMSRENWQLLYNSISSASTYNKLLQQATGFVCSDRAGQLTGMAFLVPPGNPTDIYPAAWSYIRLVSVLPDLGGNGIGKKLTQICMERAKLMGYPILALHTSEMMSAARHLYTKLGFTIEKALEPRFGKRYWLYRLDLKGFD